MKSRAITVCFVALFSFFSANKVISQTNEIMSSPSGLIKLHTSLPRYISGEPVIFTAYIQQDTPDVNPVTDNSLYTAILDQDGAEVANGIFPVKNGMVDGNLILPSQLTDGNYILIACPTRIKNSAPGGIYSKIIPIKRSGKNSLSPYIQLSDTLYKAGSKLNAKVSFYGNNDELVPVSFEYKLENGSSELLTGKGKSEKNTPSEVSFTLPSFRDDDKLILKISGNYKGVKRNAAVVLPTISNISFKKTPASSGLDAVNDNQLRITIKTSQPVYSQTEKIEAEIAVTGSNGLNISTSLSISANNTELVPVALRKDMNIISESGYNSLWFKLISESNDKIPQILSQEEAKPDQHVSIFSDGIRNLFAGYLNSIMQQPGRTFIVQEKNDPEKIYKRSAGSHNNGPAGYSSERSIFDIIMKIKPYRMVDNKIIFPSSGITSINNQDGALIVIDGLKFGTDARALNSVAVSDIAKITASTNSMDVQKYSGLNSVGVIEVFTKTGATSTPNETAPVPDENKPLFWQTGIKTNFFGKATISFYNHKSLPVKITVAGINEKGETGSNSVEIGLK